MKKFTGTANVYNDSNLIYSMECVNGTLNGKFIKYCEYQPSTYSGMIGGYISRNWRQPQLEIPFRADLIDGQVIIYKENGSRHFLLNYSMGILQGEQKHYTGDVTRVVHQFEKGKYLKSDKQYKNWLPRWPVELDEVASHKDVKYAVNGITAMFNRS